MNFIRNKLNKLLIIITFIIVWLGEISKIKEMLYMNIKLNNAFDDSLESLMLNGFLY